MRRVRLAVAGLVAVAALAGCSGGEEAAQTLPSTSRTAASPSPTLPPLGPADFPVPPEARQQTPDGVKAFTDYYISLINRLETDLDSRYLKALSSACTECDRIAADADADKAKGYSYSGGTLTLTSKGAATLSQFSGEIAFVFDQAPLEIRDRQGKRIEDLSSPQLSSLPGGLSTVWSDDHWVVSSLSFG